jgi:hypothetical protein
MTLQLFALTTVTRTALWAGLVLVAVLGLVAVLSPSHFRSLATSGSRWFDTNKVAAIFDKQFEVDRYVLPFSRLLGVTVLLAVVVLTYVIARFS